MSNLIFGSNQNKISRNNTNFSTIIHEKLSKVKIDDRQDSPSALRYFQDLTYTYLAKLNIDSKGLLIYFRAGQGKTMLAVAIAEKLKYKYSPIILTTKSLQSNFKKEILKFRELIGKTEQQIDKYSFVTLNASNMLQQLKRTLEVDDEQMYVDKFLDEKLATVNELGNLNGKLIIVDEAHNLFRRITNGSKIAIEFYNLIMRSPNVKLLFLTGTPIAADPFEIVLAFNMLSGYEVLPTLYQSFAENYMDHNGFIKNKEFLQNRLYGLVSYATYEEKKEGEESDFPERFKTIVEKVPMSSYQYVKYLLLRESEKQEAEFSKNSNFNAPELAKPAGSGSTTYRVKTRMCCNYYPPSYFDRKQDDISTIKPEDAGSPKVIKVFENVNDKIGLDLLYSQFVDVGGLGIIERYFQVNDWELFDLNKKYDDIPDSISNIEELSDDDKKSRRSRRYAKIMGAIAYEDREEIIKIFNSKENMYGEYISFLLVSATGAEGLDLKNIRRMHMLEPYWNAAREEQFFARGYRYKSHSMLPLEDRTTQPYIYLSDHSLEASDAEKATDTTDIHLYKKSQLNMKSIESFNQAIQEVSIECTIRKQSKCRICTPTDEPLFTMKFKKDILSTNPCIPYKEEKVKANSVMVNGEEFYYSPDKSSMFKYIVYRYSEELGGYVQLDEDLPIFESIIDAINKA